MKTTYYLKAIFAIFALILLSCANNHERSRQKNGIAAKEEEKSVNVKVTFLDNYTLTVNNLKFQYVWMFENDKRYLNPPIYTSESPDFHFCNVSHGVEIDEIIFRDSISRISFFWPTDIKDGDYRSPDSIIVSLKDGMSQKILTAEFKVASKFLLGPSATDSSAIQFNQLNLIGTVIINGVKDNFSSQVSMSGALKVKRSESVKEVIF